MYMKNFFTIIIFILSIKIFAQKNDTIRLLEIKLCELTIDFLKAKDPNLKQVKVTEMNLCPDGFVQDGRFENRIGYESEFYPGIIFQKYNSEENTISKLHLTKDFKGFLPTGIYIDMSKLKAIDVLEQNDRLNTWTSRGCSKYWGINDEKIFYYVKINTNKKPQYPIDEKYYSEQAIEGIDIISNCYEYFEEKSKPLEPLVIMEGKEVKMEVLYALKPEEIDQIIIIKDKNATDKYGEKATNGVIEVYLKK